MLINKFNLNKLFLRKKENKEVDLESTRGEVRSLGMKAGLSYYDRVMLDSPHNFEKVTIKKSFIISSNVGISTIINDNYKEDPSVFTDRIYKMGLSTPLEIELAYPIGLKMPVPNK